MSPPFEQTAGLLASVQYAPSVYGAPQTTSETPAAVDTTNLTISFTAPLSGNVLVRVTGAMYIDNATSFLCMFTHDTATQVTDSMFLGSATGQTAFCASAVVTGLTAGTSYQWDLGFMCNGTVFVLLIQGGTGVTGGPGGPLVMEIWAA